MWPEQYRHLCLAWPKTAFIFPLNWKAYFPLFLKTVYWLEVCGAVRSEAAAAAANATVASAMSVISCGWSQFPVSLIPTRCLFICTWRPRVTNLKQTVNWSPALPCTVVPVTRAGWGSRWKIMQVLWPERTAAGRVVKGIPFIFILSI